MFSKVLGVVLAFSIVQVSIASPTPNNKIEILDEGALNSLMKADQEFEEFNKINLEDHLPVSYPDEILNSVYKENDEQAWKCVAEHYEELKEIVMTVRAEIHRCVEVAAAKIAVIRDNILAIRAKLHEKLEEAKQLILECMEENPGKPDDIIRCVNEKGEPLRQEIMELIEAFKNAIHDAQKQVPIIIQEARGCIMVAVEDAKAKIQKIVELVQKCIEESSGSTTAEAILF